MSLLTIIILVYWVCYALMFFTLVAFTLGRVESPITIICVLGLLMIIGIGILTINI